MQRMAWDSPRQRSDSLPKRSEISRQSSMRSTSRSPFYFEQHAVDALVQAGEHEENVAARAKVSWTARLRRRLARSSREAPVEQPASTSSQV